MLHPRGRDQRMASSKSGAQRSCMRKRGNELSWNEGYELFAVMFAGQHLPMRSSAVVDCQCRSTKRGARTGPLVFSVRCYPEWAKKPVLADCPPVVPRTIRQTCRSPAQRPSNATAEVLMY